jgi:hypothetical protein
VRSTDSSVVTWADVDSLMTERWSAWRTGRFGAMRSYRVPSPAGGTMLVEVTLRPRWCSIAVDRWRTTDRDEALARPWLEANVWPIVCRSHDAKKTGSGVLPSGNPTITSAYPVDRQYVLALLTAWIDAELTWGLPRPTESEARRTVREP